MRSWYSSPAGSGEENIMTGIRARARHRGQCSIASHGRLGLMLSRHRGQFQNIAARAGAATSRSPITRRPLGSLRSGAPGPASARPTTACRWPALAPRRDPASRRRRSGARNANASGSRTIPARSSQTPARPTPTRSHHPLSALRHRQAQGHSTVENTDDLQTGQWTRTRPTIPSRTQIRRANPSHQRGRRPVFKRRHRRHPNRARRRRVGN